VTTKLQGQFYQGNLYIFKKVCEQSIESTVRKSFWKITAIYDFPPTVNQSLPNALTAENIKPGYFVTGIWPLNTDMYSEEDSRLLS
jgi:hypothetical protein